jgi:hypothetical protein
MGSPQLDNLVRIRQLKAETPAQAELDGLMRTKSLAFTAGLGNRAITTTKTGSATLMPVIALTAPIAPLAIQVG